MQSFVEIFSRCNKKAWKILQINARDLDSLKKRRNASQNTAFDVNYFQFILFNAFLRLSKNSVDSKAIQNNYSLMALVKIKQIDWK